MVRIPAPDPADTIWMIEVIDYVPKGEQLASEDEVLQLRDRLLRITAFAAVKITPKDASEDVPSQLWSIK